MKTIIIHHVQEMWHHGLKQHGSGITEMVAKVYHHLKVNNYDKVIVTNYDSTGELEEVQKVFRFFYPKVYDYAYGWERSEVHSDSGLIEGIDYCEGKIESEIVYMPKWLRALKGEVFLCGAFNTECIDDMECALLGAEINVTRIDELIV